MATSPIATDRQEFSFAGLRMTADEFLQIDDEANFYELIDGVVVVSPSPSPKHQLALMEISRQLANHCAESGVGRVFPETDVHLGQSTDGKDIVYRPEMAFVTKNALKEIGDRLVGAPAIVVEVISRGSRRIDTDTKLKDYERFGVGEYWLVDPENDRLIFYRLIDGKFEDVSPSTERFECAIASGFTLDISKVRQAYSDF